jgi:hypothetical protein
METKALDGFITPHSTSKVKDVFLVKYCNAGMGYALMFDDTYSLVKMPILTNTVLEVISNHGTLDECKIAFFKEKEKFQYR